MAQPRCPKRDADLRIQDFVQTLREKTKFPRLYLPYRAMLALCGEVPCVFARHRIQACILL
jgi:hypothetical protein